MPPSRPAAAARMSSLLGLLLAAAPLAAQDVGSDAGRVPLVTDRPDFTESASTVAPGLVQLETGYTFSRSGDARQHDVGELLLRVGVRERIELRLGVNSFSVLEDGREAEGFQDASIGLKANLFGSGADGEPRTALLVGTTLPTGADGFGADGLQTGAILALAWDLPAGWGLGANLGYERIEDEGEDIGQGTASVALGVPVTERLGAFLESFVLVPEGSREVEPFVDGGFTYLPSPDLQLDVRVGLGFEGPDPDYLAGTGLSVRW